MTPNMHQQLSRALAHDARTARLQLEEELMFEESRTWRRVEAEIMASPNVYMRRLMEQRR